MSEAHIRREATGIRAMILPPNPHLMVNISVTQRVLGEGEPLYWLSQLAVEEDTYRAGVLSLIKLKNPRTAAENQEDSKSST